MKGGSMSFRRIRLKNWVALCEAILEDRPFSRIALRTPVQLSLI